MVRQVCVSFEGAPFSLVDAARRMVQMHPSAPSRAFTEGWEAMVANGEIITLSAEPPRYQLQSLRPDDSTAVKEGVP